MKSLNLNENHLMGVAAVLFAGFALWQFTKKPGGQLSSQPAQRQQDSYLKTWNDMVATSYEQAAGLSKDYSLIPISDLTFGSTTGA